MAKTQTSEAKTQTSDEYVGSGGSTCPVCKSRDITGDSFEADGSDVWNEISCAGCGATWVDIYTLTSYENLQEKGK